jgi:hypothetical protein
MKFERYAIVVGRTNMGATFKAAAEAEIKFVHLNPLSKQYEWSSTDNDPLPKKADKPQSGDIRHPHTNLL